MGTDLKSYGLALYRHVGWLTNGKRDIGQSAACMANIEARGMLEGIRNQREKANPLKANTIPQMPEGAARRNNRSH